MIRYAPLLVSLSLVACGPPGDDLAVSSSPLLGALDKAVIDDVIRDDMDGIRSCYQKALTREPTLEGRLVTKFVIGADGWVERAELATDQIGDDALADCILDHVETLEFPPPTGGGIVIVRYPFVFSPG